MVIVTGIPRSGTSMMMRMLEAGGVPSVYDQVADEFNPGGYYEDPAAMAGDLSGVPAGHAVKCLQKLPSATVADARVIVMRRYLAEAIASANRMAAARGRPPLPAGYDRNLTGDLDAIRNWCATRPHIEVWYEDALRNTPDTCYRVARFLGLDTDLLPAMQAVVRCLP